MLVRDHAASNAAMTCNPTTEACACAHRDREHSDIGYTVHAW